MYWKKADWHPEMQKRAYNLVRALVENDENPVVSIHDHGSAGHLNHMRKFSILNFLNQKAINQEK